MTKWLLLAATAVLALSGPAQAQKQAQLQEGVGATFKVADRAFTFAVPDGYCLPEGADLALAEAYADFDTINFTHASIQRCDAVYEDYSLIKSMRKAKQLNVTKAIFVPLMARTLENELGGQLFESGLDQARKDLSAGTGDSLKLGEAAARSAGFDADCAYILGSAQVSVGELSQVMNFATCMTLVEGQVFAVHAYADAKREVPDDTLKARSRAIAASLAMVP